MERNPCVERDEFMRSIPHIPLPLLCIVGAWLSSGCDIPACDAAAGNLPSTQATPCEIPEGIGVASAVTNAHAWVGEGGMLTITLDDVGRSHAAATDDPRLRPSNARA